MGRRCRHRCGIAWLEILFALAILALLSQLITWSSPRAVSMLDVRHWSRMAWFAFNAAIVIVLLVIRFGPSLREAWCERRARIVDEQEKLKKKEELRRQVEALQRLKEGRPRRIY